MSDKNNRKASKKRAPKESFIDKIKKTRRRAKNKK